MNACGDKQGVGVDAMYTHVAAVQAVLMYDMDASAGFSGDADAPGGRGDRGGAGAVAAGERIGLLTDTSREARRLTDLHAAVCAFAPQSALTLRPMHVTSFCITPDLMDTIAMTYCSISALALFMRGCHLVTPYLLSGAKQVCAYRDARYHIQSALGHRQTQARIAQSNSCGLLCASVHMCLCK